MNRTRFELCVVALALHAGAAAGAQETGGVTTASSEVRFHTNNVVTTRATATAQTYATLLQARMLGGPVLFSQWLAVSNVDPQFAAALLQAQTALWAAGAGTLLGPTLLFSETITDVSTTTVRTGYSDVNSLRADQLLVGTLERVGPTQIQVGDFGVCTNYTLLNIDPPVADFVLPTGCTGGALRTINVFPGDAVLETRAALFLDPLETETTTTTRQLRQTYELVGLPATTTVPEPSTLALVLAGVVVLGVRRRFDRARHRGRG